MPFEFKKLELPEIILITPRIFRDERGYFLETYKHSDFAKAGITEDFIQDNVSSSGKNALRGLHYQKNPDAQGKLVRCSKGEVLDVAVDIRKNSPRYGKWVSVILSENKNILYIPAGFAHGYQAISGCAEVLYKTTKEYSPENERGIIWNDPDIGVKWNSKEPLLSAKDRLLPPLKDADNNFTFRG